MDSDPQKILAVRVSMGLCNRMRVLLCSIAYSELTGRRLLIYWARNRNYPFRMSDLWTHTYSQIGQMHWRWLNWRAGEVVEAKDMRLDRQDPILCCRTLDKFCVNAFPHPLIHYMNRIEPLPEIRNMVNLQKEAWVPGRPVVGVSLRTVRCHRETARYSPPQWFVKRMLELRQAFPDVQFFLSTDSRESEQEILNATGALVHVLPKTYAFNRKNGVQEALADLMILARCDYILASHFSSFSDMACEMQARGAFENSLSARSLEEVGRSLRSPA